MLLEIRAGDDDGFERYTDIKLINMIEKNKIDLVHCTSDANSLALTLVLL
jgi:hypothetical protein